MLKPCFPNVAAIIKQRQLLSTLIFLLLVDCLPAQDNYFIHQDQRERKRFNVILLMADDLGYGDVGFNGNKKIITPHLDQMSRDGIRFDHFYAAAPLCSPTRASCLTGRSPFRQGIFAAHTGGMRPSETTITEVVKKQASLGSGTWDGCKRIKLKAGVSILPPGITVSTRCLPQKVPSPPGIPPGHLRDGRDLDHEKMAPGVDRFMFIMESR